MAGKLERLTDCVLLYKFRYEVMQKTVNKLLEERFANTLHSRWLTAERYLSPFLVERPELSERSSHQPRHQWDDSANFAASDAGTKQYAS